MYKKELVMVKFRNPPQQVPSHLTVDGPIIGNGDIGITMNWRGSILEFWMSKNDFWRPLHGQDAHFWTRTFGAPSPIGYIEMDLINVDVNSLEVWQDMASATIYGKVNISQTKVTKAGILKFKAWVSAEDNLFMIEFNPDVFHRIRYSIVPKTGYLSNVRAEDDGDDAMFMTREFVGDKLNWDSKVAVYSKGINYKEILGSPTYLFFQGGERAFIATGIYTNQETENPLGTARNRACSLDIGKIDIIRETHERWWDNFWNKSEVDIEDQELYRYYKASLYILACCSRNKEFPPGIYGNWITTDTPGWASDYHLNYNYQAPFWALYSSNHIELTECYDAPLLAFMEKGRKAARNLLNCKGIYYQVGIGPKGLSTSTNKFFQQRSNAAFCTANMIMRYYYTYDLEYAEKIYLFLYETMEFWEDYLTFENGRYVSYNDAVNEVRGDKTDHVNPIISLGLIKTLAKSLVDISNALNRDRHKREKWQHIHDHLSEFPTFEYYGKTIFAHTEGTHKWQYSNGLPIQHIYPGGNIGLLSDKAVLDIGYNTVSAMQRWHDGNAFPSYYPAAARVGYNPEEIIKHLKQEYRLCYENLSLNSSGGGIENCAAVPATINELLLQSHENVLIFFPNWPKHINVKYENIRAYGAFLVCGELKAGEIKHISIYSEKGRRCVFKNPFSTQAQVVKANTRERVKVLIERDLISFGTDSGMKYQVEAI